MSKIETVEEHCLHPDCVYRDEISVPNHGLTPCCDYILLTGKARNCEIGTCDKYQRGKRVHAKQNHYSYYNSWTVKYEN